MKRHKQKYEQSLKLVSEVIYAMTNNRINPDNDQPMVLTNSIGRSRAGYAMFNRMANSGYIEKELETYANITPDEKSAQAFVRRLDKATTKCRRQHMQLRWIVPSAAAIVLAIIAIGVRIMVSPPETIHPFTSAGMTVPTLITDDGKMVELDKESDRLLLAGGYATVDKNGLRHSSDKAVNEGGGYGITTVIVPNRYMFNVTLEDGTHIMLNANSELSYPLRFDADKRTVTLTGEGMFEVAADPQRPFIINTGGLRLKVYGTRFNVNSNRSGCVEVLLESGSLGVAMPDKDEILLEPHQMLRYNTDNNDSEIEYVDPAITLAWRRGFFMTDLQELSHLMDDISSWYGITFLSRSPKVLNRKVSVMIDRNMEVDALLETLQIAAGIKILKVNERCYEIR